MADVFTVFHVITNGTLAAHATACKAYLDTLTATKIDNITFLKSGQQKITQVTSHA